MQGDVIRDAFVEISTMKKRISLLERRCKDLEKITDDKSIDE
jgi:hypothetical protein